MYKHKIKWVSSYNTICDIYTKKYILFKGDRIPTYKFIDLIDLLINNIHCFERSVIQLNSRWLKDVYGNKYNNIIEYLIYKNVIELHKNYSTGKNCKTYKFTEDMKNSSYISSKVLIPIILEKRKDNIKGLKELTFLHEYNEDVIIHLKKSLSLVELDYEKSKKFINDNIVDKNSLLINTSIIDRINNKDIYNGFDKYGRFHTNYTVLKKEIREKHLSINGNELVELDVKNSQPFFMSIIMKNNNFYNEEYHNDVIDGRLYEKLMKCSGKGRKQVKQDVFRILYGRNRKHNKNKIEECFKEIYPDVYKWILEYKDKNKNYKILAQQLQKTESKFIFNKVIPKILEYNNIPIITVHDSILFEKQYYDDINIIWQDCLKTILD